MKKGRMNVLLIFILFFSVFSLPILYAQDETSIETIKEPTVSGETGEVDEIPEIPRESIEEQPEKIEVYEIVEQAEEEFEDAKLEEGAGITPDSTFYFVEDAILSNFRGDLENREKKIAEIKAMIEAGNIDAARESLQRYERYAENFQREANPERRDDARRSAVAISRTINEIKGDIPEEDRDEFTDILKQEENLLTATEISSKIKELCTTLSELDPIEYSRVCKTEDDAPTWQRDLNRELTKEQEQEAKAFFEIMSQCFDASGKECRCEDISVSSFAEKCSIIAPLAAACDKGDEDACDKMEEIEQEEPIEDLLPDYLQEVLAKAEGKYDEGRYDLRMPPECVKEGATTSKDCVKIMFKTHAPEECQQALEKGEISFTNEKEAREACDKIMFESNAPPECVEAGVKNPKECGKIMFKVNAPAECIEAGLTGENKGDDKKCREIMESQRRDEGPRGSQGGFGGANCGGIQDSMERLKCYDSASQGFGEQIERVEIERREVKEYREEMGGQKCPDGTCDEFEQSHSYACPEDCGGTREVFEERREEFQPPQERIPPEGYIQPPEGEFQQPPSEQPSTESSPTTSIESSGGGESIPSSEPSSSGEGTSSLTGAVVFDDEFSSYYFR